MMTCFLMISVRINSSCWEICLIPLFFINFWCSQRTLLMGESIQRPHFLSSPHSITIMDSESSQIPVQLLRPKRLHWKVAEILVHLCHTLLHMCPWKQKHVPMGNEYIILQWNDTVYKEQTSVRALLLQRYGWRSWRKSWQLFFVDQSEL